MRSDVEAVEASTVKMGDEIFIPNSRKQQEVTQIVTNDDGTISLVVANATWVVNPDQSIRRVTKPEED